ncbi:hypothetical protein [Chitinophaga agri]|uniref:Uncharacterized protein n=1 Tax=Chitinophaga agri TaxID=2703787 RepID=A0A6B9ZE24_9BACT|nr:hypothetical protein [Chitinophaga agri]QHS59564.1 hypothetical protein GWR21_08170 [Chitinophaga agri]
MKFLEAATRKMRSWKGLLFTTLFYLFFTLLGEGDDTFKQQWLMALIFLPGILFPLLTCDYRKLAPAGSRITMLIIHITLSIAIYLFGAGIWSLGVEWRWAGVVAGVWGSFAYRVLTHYLLEMELSMVQMLIAGLLSGLSFAPPGIFTERGWAVGYAVTLWTLVNGGMMLYNGRERQEQLAQ